MFLGTNDPMELGWAQLQAIPLGLFSSVEEPRGLSTQKHRVPLGKKGSVPLQFCLCSMPASPTPSLASVLGKVMALGVCH